MKAPTGPWTLEVTNPPDAAPALIQGLKVGRGAAVRQVIGRPENHLPSQYELFGQLELRDGRISVAQPDTEYDTAPPDIDQGRAFKPNRKRKVLGAIEAPELDALSDSRTLKITPLDIRCSPVRVLEDGEPLPLNHESCSDKNRGRLGRVCHGPKKRIVFSTSDGEPLNNTDRSYVLALDPSRNCMGGRWLYPGDRMVPNLGPEVLGRFREGARSLTLTGASADKNDAVVPLLLTVDGEIVLRDVLPLGGTKPVTTHVQLDRPLWPSDANVQLIVENPEDRYVLITGGVLAAGNRAR